MCLFPRVTDNPKYKPNKKNAGVIPGVSDTRVLSIPVGCGYCMECKRKKKNEWTVRLNEDIKRNTNGTFVTLTFSTESYQILAKHCKYTLYVNKKFKKYPKHFYVKYYRPPKLQIIRQAYELDNAIATRAVHLFRERWRKQFKHSPRHWLVTELGQNGWEHIHLHGIIWSKNRDAIEKHWKYGFIWPTIDTTENYVSERTVNYIVKYITKTDPVHKTYNPKILTSPGIGKGYTTTHAAEYNKYKPGTTKETYTTRTGHELGLPMYYRNKLWTEEEREKLWIEKLDKNVRYVNGREIDISKGEEEYYNALKAAQKLNKELGYLDRHNKWRREVYEHERRNIIINKRLNNE